MSLLVLILLSSVTYHYGKSLNKYTNLDSVKYSLSTPSNTYELSQDNNSNKLNYSPVVGVHAGLSLTQNNFTLGISFVDPLSKDEQDKGVERSKYFDISFKKAKDRFIYEAYYQHYSGFKLNSGNFNDNSLLDIESINYGVDINFFFKEDFKTENTIGHFALIRNNDWSSFMSLGIQQNSLLSKKPLVPQSLESEFSDYKGFKGFYRESIYAQYGYAGQYLFHDYYIQPLIGAGLNLSTINYKGNELKTTTKTAPSFTIQFNLGKKFKTALLGFEFSNIIVSDKQNDSSFNSSKTEVVLYYNYFF